MILSITMNPSVDIAYQIKDFHLDSVNRVEETYKTPGGKGLNVTRVLSQLNEAVVASGLIGGKLGEFIENELDKQFNTRKIYLLKAMYAYISKKGNFDKDRKSVV